MEWVYSSGWGATPDGFLHCVVMREYAEVWSKHPEVAITGKTMCGRTLELRKPDAMQAIDGQRCSRCCLALGIKSGPGTPEQEINSPPTYYTPEEMAKIMKVSVRTLQNWRCAGAGPPFKTFVGSVRYGKKEFEDWKSLC